MEDLKIDNEEVIIIFKIQYTLHPAIAEQLKEKSLNNIKGSRRRGIVIHQDDINNQMFSKIKIY